MRPFLKSTLFAFYLTTTAQWHGGVFLFSDVTTVLSCLTDQYAAEAKVILSNPQDLVDSPVLIFYRDAVPQEYRCQHDTANTCKVLCDDWETNDPAKRAKKVQ